MIRILTDSTCDLLPAEAARLGVEVVHMQVRFENGEVFRDGLDITPDEFYSRLAKCDKLPTTSQPSPQDFMDRFEEAKAAGDEVVAIVISGQLSGTYQSARIAADACEYDRIHLVDSMNATLGEQLLVRLAVKMRGEGATAAEIVEELERRRMDVRLVAVVDDLKYFRKGGRLTGAQALAGSLLGVKPVVAVRDGKVGLARRVCGAVQADGQRGRAGRGHALHDRLYRPPQGRGAHPPLPYPEPGAGGAPVPPHRHRHRHPRRPRRGGRGLFCQKSRRRCRRMSLFPTALVL